MDDHEVYRQWLIRSFNATGKPKGGLAKALGTDNGAVSKLLSGGRRLALGEVRPAAKYLGVPPPPIFDAHLESSEVLEPEQDLDEKTGVPIVGDVIAGEEADYLPIHEAGKEHAPFMDNSTPKTVALRVKGESMGDWLQGWLVYFDDVRSPVVPELVGQLCVVKIKDGPPVVKLLRRGTKKGRFTLVSDRNMVPPIENVEVQWAAKVKAFVDNKKISGPQA